MKVSIRIVEHESGNFEVRCPSMPGCTSQAKTVEEARAGIRHAISGYLASMGGFVPDGIDLVLVEKPAHRHGIQGVRLPAACEAGR